MWTSTFFHWHVIFEACQEPCLSGKLPMFSLFFKRYRLRSRLCYHVRIWGWVKANGFSIFGGWASTNSSYPGVNYRVGELSHSQTQFPGSGRLHISQWDQDFLLFAPFPLKNYSGQTITHTKNCEVYVLCTFFPGLRLPYSSCWVQHHFCRKHRIARPATCTSSPQMCRWVRGPRPPPLPSPRQRPRPARKVARKKMKRLKRPDGLLPDRPKATPETQFFSTELGNTLQQRHLTFDPIRVGCPVGQWMDEFGPGPPGMAMPWMPSQPAIVHH